jgi:predicted metalloprotease with PDZ domain
LRLTSLRGVNLDVLDFDFDLTWTAFFMDGDERVLGRFGGRPADGPDRYRTLDGLRYAMTAALRRHKDGPPGIPPPARPAQTVDQYPGIARFAPKQCAHCHHAYDLRREALEDKGTWTLDEVWVYPVPENVGWTLAVDPGNRITAVAAKSPASDAGMQPEDVLLAVNGHHVASFSDVQYALHRTGAAREIGVEWKHGGKMLKATLKLPADWRHTDLSWRRSLKGLEPGSGLHGYDLTVEEKKKFGLGPKALAFYQGNFVTPQARQAGVQQNDVIVGLDGKALELTARQFDAHVRLHYHKGDTVSVEVLRDGKRLELRMKLAG